MNLRNCKADISEQPLISVIIPVYNVAEYLPVCLKSVTEQSIRDIEILLIDDGSTDASYQICLKWAETDPRIRCFHQENRGVSYARNKGLEEARAEYIAFIDSDDWVDQKYLEKLYNALLSSGASYAECDLWRCDNRTGKRIYRSCSGRMGVPWTFEEHLKYGPTACYKAMSKRSLWMEHHVRFPDCSFESPAVYALILALSGKVESVPEALYYYRRFRPGSLIEKYASKEDSSNNTLGIEAMRKLVDGFERHGLRDQYLSLLPGIIIYRLNDILAMQFHRKEESDFRENVRNIRLFLKELFPERCQIRYLSWGGYNLNRILTQIEYLHDPSCRFNFSSIISIVGNKTEIALKDHPNRYRGIMLEREQKQLFWRMLGEQQPQFIFLDLLEERFDILQFGEGYLTISDAFEDLYSDTAEIFQKGRRISRLSEECTQLWKQSARSFFERLKTICPGIKVVIIENYLSECFGDVSEQIVFSEILQIRDSNCILRSYYEFLRELLPEAGWISPSKDRLYFTDRNYEYGAEPSHLNEIENKIISMSIEQLIKLD